MKSRLTLMLIWCVTCTRSFIYGPLWNNKWIQVFVLLGVCVPQQEMNFVFEYRITNFDVGCRRRCWLLFLTLLLLLPLRLAAAASSLASTEDRWCFNGAIGAIINRGRARINPIGCLVPRRCCCCCVAIAIVMFYGDPRIDFKPSRMDLKTIRGSLQNNWEG